MSDLFSWADGCRLRDQGMSLAASRDPGFGVAAYEIIKSIAARQPELHIDDVLIEAHANNVIAKSPNAWGAVWMRAIKSKIIVRSERTRQCRSDSGKHAHRYPIYISLIHGANEGSR